MGVFKSLGTQNCNDYLMSGQSIESILPGLARKAAVGDLFGIGDRHFENYMIHDGHILSVDVSILFWPNNEEWSARYMSAGLYEITALRFLRINRHCFKIIGLSFSSIIGIYIELISGFLKPLSEELSLLCDSEEASRCVSFLGGCVIRRHMFYLSNGCMRSPFFTMLVSLTLQRFVESNRLGKTS